MKYGSEVPVGDGPCTDCGNENPFIWFTDNVVWNSVCRVRDEPEPVLCPTCFRKRLHAEGYRPTAMRIIPEWPWSQEAAAPPEGG